MFLCLSSGAREQYRKDIILALAMPEGSRLQFRYDRKWVAPNVLDKIQDGSCVGVRALIAYIDQHDKTRTPYLTPCRFASISDAHVYGTTVTIGLFLKEFAYSENLDSFNQQANALSGNVVPKWGKDGQPVGFYCFDVDTNISSPIISSNELDVWENIVTQIAQKADFLSEKCFYIFQGIKDICKTAKIPLKEGYFELKPSAAYEIEIYHYHPTEGKSKAFLRLQTETSIIKPNSNPMLAINSRYDVKHFRFQTSRPFLSEIAAVSIFRGDDINTDKCGYYDFDLQLRINEIWGWKVASGIFAGILLGVPTITAALFNCQLSIGAKAAITIVSLVAGILVGIFASFAFKRPM
jgi:hypothetical protein